MVATSRSDDAMEALTGTRPEMVKMPGDPQYGFFLTMGPNPKGSGVLAVCTDGHPKNGDPECIVLDMSVVETEEAGRKWFHLVCMTRPWVPRDA